MRNMDTGTEERIRKAAFEVFSEKGKAGTTMREIAQRAGVNKALVHYYFRTKDSLYETIAEEMARLALRLVFRPGDEALTLEELLPVLIRRHIEAMRAHPQLFRFLIGELASNRAEFLAIFARQLTLGERHVWSYFLEKIEEARKEGRIKEMDPFQLILDIVSLNIFPLLVAPALLPLIAEKAGIELDVEQVLEERADHVARLIWDAIKKE
ncbi:regulatory protein TetR [Spirochaeta thermophila DSM 6578]|uniref:Regulatory protein TetR n=1 Tax=Winmispira thermophila (strain ATCC 700085 / DSM 6578 / Z-1203) TaxID=869211 RepID=G0GEC2_WINT7|nr:TetR/AcrR family transcriptional regulator [Spirochaeta thermophila]AEJ62259.1 regulatory protein TetR [Spirochaeta thermophila DSM 6578]